MDTLVHASLLLSSLLALSACGRSPCYDAYCGLFGGDPTECCLENYGFFDNPNYGNIITEESAFCIAQSQIDLTPARFRNCNLSATLQEVFDPQQEIDILIWEVTARSRNGCAGEDGVGRVTRYTVAVDAIDGVFDSDFQGLRSITTCP